ncbi:hypothetical protein [Rhizosphaericola mali]|uniref:Uncharacterized protein n=1 Tax=Rhizosphaericola mali TaxID=2545455 RepID=A0A5P2G2U3_9BACT|nr:hypothetical protein [Rhizosphaericola mali]QES90134.1 hypothetical protein E0W69_016260 [Rhizosphaericola mali]
MPYQHAFYYWKNNTNQDYIPDDSYDTIVRRMQISNFYVRYMDVDWNEYLKIPVPSSGLGMKDNDPINLPTAIEFGHTPVIFITNAVFQNIDDVWCKDSLPIKLKHRIEYIQNELAENFAHRIYENTPDSIRSTQNYILPNGDSIRQAFLASIKEIQIDCDWTEGTKYKYFKFIKAFRQLYPNKIFSATIRLYPFKYYKKMGIPPVDKGVLMCYNIGGVYNINTKNSILDLNEVKKYITHNDYKIPLDIALPLFSWFRWFRGNEFKGIIYKKNLNKTDANLDSIGTKRYRLLNDLSIDDNYLREGDVLIDEQIDSSELLNCANFLKEKLSDSRKIIFFHWDDKLLKDHDQTIKKIFDMY